MCKEPFGAGCTSVNEKGPSGLKAAEDTTGKSIAVAVRRKLVQPSPHVLQPKTLPCWLPDALSLFLSPLPVTAMGKPRRWCGGGNQRCAEWPLGSKCRLPVSRQDRPEPGPDESQCHQ